MFSFCELGERIFFSGYIQKILTALLYRKNTQVILVGDFHISRISYVLIL